MEHHFIEVKAKELQEKLSSQERENVRLSSEVHSFKTEVNRLEEETAFLKEENGGLHQKVLAADLESRKLLGVLSNLEVEGRRFIISLKVKLFSLEEEIMVVTEEWQNSIRKAEGIHVVYRIDQANTSEIGVYEEGTTRMVDKSLQRGQEETSLKSLDRKSVLDDSPHYWTVELVLAQLQARIEEADKVIAAVRILRQIAAKFRLMPREERPVSPVRDQPDELSVEEKRVLAMVETERSHLTLGTRLHYEEMDEELEMELRELKEGRKKLTEELSEGMEQARRVQAEAEEQLKEEAKQGGAQKRQKVARQVLEKVEVQRQRLERMQDELKSTAALQEPAIESLEEQVWVLVAKDEWDVEEAKRLRREIGSFVQQNRSQALELQSVDEELKRLAWPIAEQDETEHSSEQQVVDCVDDDAKSSSSTSSIPSRLRLQNKRGNSGRRRLSFPWIVSPQNRRRPSESSEPPRDRSAESADVLRSPAFLAPLSASSSNTNLLLEHLRDKAKCWACVAGPPKHAIIDD